MRMEIMLNLVVVAGQEAEKMQLLQQVNEVAHLYMVLEAVQEVDPVLDQALKRVVVLAEHGALILLVEAVQEVRQVATQVLLVQVEILALVTAAGVAGLLTIPEALAAQAVLAVLLEAVAEVVAEKPPEQTQAAMAAQAAKAK